MYLELLNLPLVALVTTLLGTSAVLLWRVREARQALSPRGILIPPLAMSTGFLMFLSPGPRIAWSWAVAAFLVGALVLSYPLIRSSVLTRVGDEIRLSRSRAVLGVLLALTVLRLLLRDQVDDLITPLQSAGLFFILAFGMILRWRTDLLRRYRALSTAAPRHLSS